MVAEQALNWRSTIAKRLVVTSVVFAIWTAVILGRLLFLQTVRHEDLTARAERQQLRTITAPAKRGEIVDRHGRLLAYSVDADTIYAVPTEIGDADTTAAALCGAFGDCSRKDLAALKERLVRQRAFVYVKRRVSPEEAGRVAALRLEGIGFMKESRRFYPNRDLGAHLLGYVGLDNTGLSGLEAAYDKVMLGKPGTVLVQADARRHVYDRVERAATAGGSLELSLDEQLQYIVERELAVGVRENDAQGGTAILMDPHTGEILAMASAPTFNPNDYNGASELSRRNRAVQDLYEPGSTFKLVTASAAIEEQVFRPDTPIDVSSGIIRLGHRIIDEYNGHRYGVLSLTDVIVKSSNVGAVKMGLKLGAERLGLYVNRFGFGRAGSRDFPGENPGIVWNPANLGESAVASMSMGYQVAVTPLQMLAAASAVANGGNLLEPRVVRAVTRNGVRTPVAPKIVRRAITPATAAEVTAIMEAVVERGTAKSARIPGFTIAGKTGTAEKLIDGRYSKTQNMASFVGFLPSRQPVFSLVVVIDAPRAIGRTGGVAAAPVFKRIAEAALRHKGIPLSIAPEPPVVVARRESSRVTPVADTHDTRPILALAMAGPTEASVPDVRGLGARDALRTLARLGLRAEMQGAGIVIEQVPDPGAPFDPGALCTLVLHRNPSRLLGPSGAHP
ncbi:MAG: penicillin-binding protein [Vicinamibacterales bacterium]